MPYKVRESFMGQASYGVTRFAETLDEAKSLLGEIVFIEQDDDHPGFFDAFTKTGSIYVIEKVEE